MAVRRLFVCFALMLLTVGLGLTQPSPLKAPPKRQERTVLKRAQKLAQKGDWEGARREFEKAVKSNPDDVDARMGLTEVLLRLGKFADALPHLRWLAQKTPHNPRVWATMGQVHEQLGQPDEAITALRKAVHLQPDEPEFRVHLARVLINRDRWDEAVYHLRWLAHRVPDLASVQFHLALYYERKGNSRKAFHHAKRTVQLSPKEPDARLTLARIALQLKDVKTAAEQVEALMEQFPTDAKLAMECAKLFAQAGDNERAIRYFRRTLHLRPDNADAHRALADLYSQRNEWAKALWHVRWLAKRFPDDTEVAKAEAECLVRLGHYRDAEKSLLRWAKLRPKDFEPFVHLARLYRDLNEPAKARMAYDQALFRRPPVEVIAEAADLEMRLGDFERAVKLYEWAQRRQPDNPQWRALRAEALMRAGKFDRAGRILRFALKRFPDHPRLNALMGLWHARRVEWVEAEPFLLKGIGDLDNPDLEAVGALVEIWLCQGRVSETLRLCEMLLQKRPSAEALIWWAQAMDELGKTKEAALRLERSQMFAKGDVRIAQVAAKLWELASEPAKAAAVWERFAQTARNGQTKLAALVKAAQVWERAKDFPKALNLLDKAMAINDDPSLRAERIRLMLQADAPAAALQEAQKLLTQMPDEPQAAALYAEAALRLWRDGAFERVAQRVQQDARLSGALWLIAEQLNRQKEAIALLQVALNRLPSHQRAKLSGWLKSADASPPNSPNAPPNFPDASLSWQRAQKAAEQSQIGEAMTHCRKVIAMHPDFLPAYELLLRLYQRKGDLAHAVKGFTQLANRHRDDVPLNFAAATALSLDGQHRRAIPYWRRVCALTENAPDAMLKLAESLVVARFDQQAEWCRRFVRRTQRWGHEGDANHSTPLPTASDREPTGGG
jgi:tetratricopeptide (TPR) repeat protein